MQISSVRVSALRSISDFAFDLAPGPTGIHGPNGIGKTNLLEATYFALTGRSFRTNDRRELIPWGGALARAEVTVRDRDGLPATFLAAISRTEGRRHLLDGKQADRTEATRRRPHLLVFSPDRLAIVKGSPAERRAHFDAFSEAYRPHARGLRATYGRALAQRNAILARIAGGETGRDDVLAWDRTMARAAADLIAARSSSVEALASEFAAAGSELGLSEEATIRYRPRAAGSEDEIAAELGRRHETDIRGRRTTWGPHLDEIELGLAGRAIRRYGSQGQQRVALLALLLAERAVLERSHVPPVMLLDDVMSELDPYRRRKLGLRLSGAGQSLITAADRSLLPLENLEGEIALDSGGSAR